jgi:myo-inositol-1(or 4)-monophosphatase
LWILDPIDGTTNYAHGHPQVGVSIGFMYQRQIRAGVVHAPFMGETFTAIRGGGAKLNGKPIKVSGTTELKKALVATGFPYRRDSLDQIIGRVRAVLENCRDVRRIGAGSLDICWVACGRLDAFYETLSAWDIAAATLIAREAGANVGNMVDYDNSGSAFPPDLFGEWLVTANPVLYPKIFELLQPIK